MDIVNIKIIPENDVPIPEYKNYGDAGMDIRANESCIIEPSEFKLVKTGLKIELPEGYEAQIRPRSGLASKFGVTVLNSPGTIDSGYRGEIGVILINHGKNNFVINKGERIAQLVVSRYSHVNWVVSEELSGSKRGEDGFGSSGVR
ncbi:MAG: dUTP diphosphatase [Deferribacteraceae bacterium]|jgi:dUTP pyrophosphatase|nr:dUTP diphosphatase [Deferribacteraceae bacterium]